MNSDKASKYINLKERWYHTIPASLYFWSKQIELKLSLSKKLKRNKEIRRYFGISTEIYEKYTDWEMRAYENGSQWTTNGTKMGVVSFKKIRTHYLEPVVSEIAKLHRELSRPIRVLEVGCGNGTNLQFLKTELGDKVNLTGIDISRERIEQGKNYWGDRLTHVSLRVDSATQLNSFNEDEVDIIYTVHCLEQLPYNLDTAIEAIHRVTAHTAVFVEPVWEFANTAQRMYTLFADQLRTLLPALENSNFQIVKTEKAKMLANPLNQTGFIIARKISK